MHTIKRIALSTILSIALAGIVAGPALADTPPNVALFGLAPVAEWIFSPSAISVVPAQGYVTIASATFTTARNTYEWWGTYYPSGTAVTWSMDAEASAVFQAQSSSTLGCIINIAIPGAVPNTGAGIQGVVTPTFALGDSSTATAKMVGIQLYADTTYTITASIAASGAGCNQIGNALVKFTLKLRITRT